MKKISGSQIMKMIMDDFGDASKREAIMMWETIVITLKLLGYYED